MGACILNQIILKVKKLLTQFCTALRFLSHVDPQAPGPQTGLWHFLDHTNTVALSKNKCVLPELAQRGKGSPRAERHHASDCQPGVG